MKARVVRRKPFWMITVLVLAALLLAACQTTDLPPTGATATSAGAGSPAETQPAITEPAATEPAATEPVMTEAPAAGEEAEISVATDPELGEILVGNEGMTLYMFTRDEPNTVNCEGDCLVQWPPLVTQGDPVLGEGVDPALVGTAELPDGQMIVTYNEMPLYYWINDQQAGDVTGQGVGDVWYVVSPEGEVIGLEATEPAATEGAAAGTGDEAELNVATDPELGEILVGNEGMTLYMFTVDEPNTVNCEGDCLVQWPPLITQGEPVLGEGIDPELVGTAELPDGQLIVTYNEMPLYYWINDQQAGDVTGQGVGDVWYVVSPEGEVIGMEGTSSAPANSNEGGNENEGGNDNEGLPDY